MTPEHPSRLTSVSAFLGATDGQVYTAAIGAVLAVVLLVTGVLPMRERRQPIASVFPPAGVTTSDDSEFTAAAPAATTTVPLQSLSAAPAPVPPRSAAVLAAPTTTTTAPPAASDPPPPPSAAGPLRVVFGRWSTGPIGESTGHPDVPRDGLPVGARLGEDDTRSYIRLAGGEPILVLAEVEDAVANRSAETAAITACAIVDRGWAVENGVPHEEAPAFDPERCAPGVRSDDGTWSFDLSAFDAAQRTGDAGFALVPASSEAPFQVVFSRTPAPEAS